ncbi:ABC-2 type transporter family protein isoform 1 [Hibiscus syriacus]|uniref:ABC-2 type transporter family protein isoform 1 n=1 Tax=Hibiscus syriacus TaxID=106335 RepID=A0A6A3CLW2_HIBSY|nr:uncharacterized protein LOC120173569 [Hibiscus syriacus]KAE8730113.1 ABC-2 type transporter family protein isoform 1 [Hibiscus syriacus]
METTSVFNNSIAAPSSLPLPLPLPFSGKSTIFRKRVLGILASKRYAHSHDFDGKLVDESMIVLRRRIHEMTTSEKNYEPPRHWMDWEKEYKKENYDRDVCEAAGYLQSKLMETRPSLALGMALLFLFTLPTSFAVVMYHVMHMIKG